MPKSVIVAGARTPIGKLSGSLSALSAQQLGGAAIKEALRRAGVPPELIDVVLMGQVISAGQGQVTARQAAVNAGIPMSVHCTTVNKVCLSGLQSMYLADLMIRSGEAEIIVAGGMESMTNAPYLMSKVRSGLRFGDSEVMDSILSDALTCAYDGVAMGLATEHYNAGRISRQRQDEFAARSHELAAAAMKSGTFADEIGAVSVPQRRGDDVLVDTDEGVRSGTSVESLSRLSPAFETGGTITAGNSSQLSDGAAAIILMSDVRAAELGLTPIAEIVGYGQVAGPDASLLSQPSRAISLAAAKAGVAINKLDLVEINEAFAAVGLHSSDELEIDENLLNVNGGAIALGHPVGMSGTRVALSAILELRRRGGQYAGVGLCGGGGQGDGAVFRLLS